MLYVISCLYVRPFMIPRGKQDVDILQYDAIMKNKIDWATPRGCI